MLGVVVVCGWVLQNYWAVLIIRNLKKAIRGSPSFAAELSAQGGTDGDGDAARPKAE